MLNELKQKLAGCYPAGCAAELEEMEAALLHYPAFTSEDALALGAEIVRQSKQYGDIAVCIHRLRDGAVIFQSIGDACAERNIGFAMMKRETVLKTGHCSLWSMAQEQTMGGVDAVFAEGSGCLPAGGAFPIFVAGEMVATVATSGLHDGMDYTAVVAAFAALRGVAAPGFSGKLI